MANEYKAPPLVEAIYEVQFKDGPGWSELSYGRLEAAVADRFDGNRDTQEAVGVEIQFGPDGMVTPGPAPRLPRKRRIWTKDGGELFQFSSSMCAFNVLSQYKHFDLLTDNLEKLFDLFTKEAQPTATQFVGQRYINRVVLPSGQQDPSAYFEVYPRLPLSVAHRPFALQVVSERFDGGEVTVNLAYQGDDGGKAVFFLDVYARSTTPVLPMAHEIRMWQERAHPFVRSSFEAVLTAKSRELFGLERET